MVTSDDSSVGEPKDPGFVIDSEEEEEDGYDRRTPWVDFNDASTSICYDQANYEAWISAQIEISVARRNILQRLKKRTF